MSNIKIIGAGPIGCYCGYRLGKHFDVEIFEEDKEIGKPKHCTGIVTNEINKILKIPKNVVVNKIKKAELISPNNESVTLNVDDIVLDRVKFDQFLAEKAEDIGCKIRKNKRMTNAKGDFIIGADGAMSEVAKKNGMFGIYILDSKEPSINPDGEYGLKWGDGIRWYGKEQLNIIEEI